MRKAVYRWFERNRWAGDGIFAFGFGLVLLAETDIWSHWGLYELARIGLVIATAGLVLLRRVATRFAVTAGVPVMLVNLELLGTPNTGIALVPILVHAAVAHAPGRSWGRFALVTGLIGAVAGPLTWWDGSVERTISRIAIALCAVVVIAAFVIGERQRDRADFVAEQLRTLAERNRLLAAERDQRATIAAAAERTRIARELHDIVAHSLSVVVVQADGAAAAVAKRPELAPQVLTTISETAREALREMRSLVGVLRSGGEELGGTDTAQYAPAPGVADLGSLVAGIRQAGREVVLERSALPWTLSAPLQLTVYRVVQEALTNVLKHAGPTATAKVRVAAAGDALEVSVVDDGRGAAVEPDGLGNGLTGMRERVALHGGTVIAGPVAGGGFAVRAVLPMAGRMVP